MSATIGPTRATIQTRRDKHEDLYWITVDKSAEGIEVMAEIILALRGQNEAIAIEDSDPTEGRCTVFTATLKVQRNTPGELEVVSWSRRLKAPGGDK